MDLGIKDKVALVTASSGGMGRNIAHALAAEGAHGGERRVGPHGRAVGGVAAHHLGRSRPQRGARVGGVH